MKRRAASQKPAKKPRSKDSRWSQKIFAIPGLIEHFRERDIRSIPSRSVIYVNENGNIESRPVSEVCGIPLPPDLGQVCERKARMEAQWMENALACHFVCGKRDLTLDIQDEHVAFFENVISDALESGFFLALLRYADDLKQVPEAAALLDAKRRGSQKGAAARRQQAAPTHKAIRKRFRELRKTVAKKTARYLRVAEEFGMSDRHVARIVEGID